MPCRLSLAALATLWIFGAVAPAGGAQQSGVDEGQQSTTPSVQTIDPVSGLRELVSLDLLAEALAQYGQRVLPDGDLHRSGEARALVARAYFATGETDALEALLETGDLGGDDERELVLARAWIAMQRDDLNGALRELQVKRNGRTIPRYYDNADATILLARIFARGGDYLRAAEHAERMLARARTHPETHTALHILAQAAVERGDPEGARILLQRRDAARRWQELYKVRRLQALRAPNDPLPRLGSALLWMEVEQWTRASTILEDLVQRWPNQSRAWFHLAECKRAQGQHQAALDAYDRTLGLDPEHAPATANRALLWIAIGRGDDAQLELERLLAGPSATDPRFAAAHLALARLLLKSQGMEAAEARYNLYRELGGTEALRD